MNCPKCGWPGLIGGHLKLELAKKQKAAEELAALKFLIEFCLKKSDAEMREALTLYLKHGWPDGEPWVPPLPPPAVKS